MAKPVYSIGDVPTADEVNDWFVNVQWARKPTTETVNNSTTLQNDNHLFLPVEASAEYEMHCLLAYSGSSPADLKVLFSVPAGAIMVGMGSILPVNATSQSDISSVPYGHNSSEIWGTFGAGTQVGVVTGTVVTAGTAGNLQVQWAQYSAVPSDTDVHAHSFLRLTRMA
jgi:hypothetical protein